MKGEANHRQAVIVHLISAWNYTWPTGRTTDPLNWTDTIHWILKTCAYHVQGNLLAKIPERGEMRKVMLHVCKLIQDEKFDQARHILSDAFESDLGPELWKELTRHFPKDVSRFLPRDIRQDFVRARWSTRPKKIQTFRVTVPIRTRVPAKVYKSVFARLADGRYRIEYAGQQDTLPGYKGLDLIRYLLRHPNKTHELMAINRDLYSDVVGPGQVENCGNSKLSGLPEGYTLAEYRRNEPLDGEAVRTINKEIARLTEQLKEIIANGDTEQAGEIQRKIKKYNDYLNERQSKLSPEQEKIRKKLHKNLKEAYSRLVAAGLTKLVKHLKEHVSYTNGTYHYYVPNPSWSFEPLFYAT